MRVSDNMNYSQINRNIGKNRAEGTDLQNQAATMKRVTKPSDDPVAAAHVLAGRTELAGIDQFQKSLSTARSFLDYSDQSLGEVTDVLARLKEMALGQANEAGSNKQTRLASATEVAQLLDQVVQVGNRKLGDRYIFGGYKTTSAPFSKEGKYIGDDGEMMVEVNKGAFVPMNMPGSRIFLGKDLSRKNVVWEGSEVSNTAERVKFEQNYEFNNPPGEEKPQAEPVMVRGPSSIQAQAIPNPETPNEGLNVFKVIHGLEIGLRTNDTSAIQNSLDELDQALDQVVLARAQVGSRVAVLDNTLDSVKRHEGDSKVLISSHEDADVFQLFTDMSRNENTLKATLNSSGKLAQLSLLDFIK